MSDYQMSNYQILMKLFLKVSNSPEVEFAMFVRNTQSNLYEINNLYLRCCFADNLRILDV